MDAADFLISILPMRAICVGLFIFSGAAALICFDKGLQEWLRFFTASRR